METLKQFMKVDKEHITRAKGIAENLYKERPHIQIEMLEEIKKYLVLLNQGTINNIKQL